MFTSARARTAWRWQTLDFFPHAFKLLVNDRGKFSALLIGITFAVFLMIQMTSMFAGVLNRSAATVSNIGASLWIMDPAVNTVANAIPVPDYLLDAVRSMSGVKFAVPLYSGGALVKLKNGAYQAVSILGLDDTTCSGEHRSSRARSKTCTPTAVSSRCTCGVRQATKSVPRRGIRNQRSSRRRCWHRESVVEWTLWSTDALYNVQSRGRRHPFVALHHHVHPRGTEAGCRYCRDQDRHYQKLGYLALTRDEFDQRISDFYKYQTNNT